MKKIALFFIVFLAHQAFAQNFTEGKISYEYVSAADAFSPYQNLLNSKQEKTTTESFKETILYIKDKQASFVHTSWSKRTFGASLYDVIEDKSTEHEVFASEKYRTFLKVYKSSFKYGISKDSTTNIHSEKNEIKEADSLRNERFFYAKNPVHIDIGLEKDTKTILGYECKKAKVWVTYDKGGEQKGNRYLVSYEVFYAPQIPNVLPEFKGLKGLPLEGIKDGNLYFVAKQISQTPVDEKLFSPKKLYTDVKFEE